MKRRWSEVYFLQSIISKRLVISVRNFQMVRYMQYLLLKKMIQDFGVSITKYTVLFQNHLVPYNTVVLYYHCYENLELKFAEFHDFLIILAIGLFIAWSFTMDHCSKWNVLITIVSQFFSANFLLLKPDIIWRSSFLIWEEKRA